MTALVWDKTGERFYEAGIERGVLYPVTGAGVAWNGLVSVEDNSAAELQPLYFEGLKMLDLMGTEDFQGSITAYSAPAEFDISDGRKSLLTGLIATGQPRKRFGLSYRTKLGNDTAGDSLGYKLHLLYNLTASPSDRNNQSDAEASNPIQLKWQIDGVPPAATTFKPTCHFVINSTKVNAAKLATLENLLYGTVSTSAGLPTQATVITTLT